MTESETPADDRTTESADMVTDPPDSDPADMTESASEATAGQMHQEVDDIAAKADPDGAGHGPKE